METHSMRVADFVFDFIARQGVAHVFFLPGGGAMHLNDGLRGQKAITPVSMLHEQGASIAAETYARTSGKFGVCLVTSGPGVTNAMTGLAGAWFESTPVIFISGQVKRADLKGDTGVRQLGPQELDAVTMVRSLTKSAVCLTEPQRARWELEKALYLMREGRPGPVWIEIPLDVQATRIDPDGQAAFDPAELVSRNRAEAMDPAVLGKLVQLLKDAKRPVLLVGNGVHCARAERELRQLIERLNIPTLTTWIAADLLEHSHPLSFGRPGTAAPRGANFTIQNADFLLAIGARLDFPTTGFNRAQFAREARIAVVDIDAAEIGKLGDLPDLSIVCDARVFIESLLKQLGADDRFSYPEWIGRCTGWKEKYPVVLPEYRMQEGFANTYVFTETLCEELAGNDLIIPGSSGAALDTFWLSAKLKKGQRAVPTGGLGAMGYGLPAAVGGCLGADRKRTISVDGDGGFVMNIQELEVAKRLDLPIKFFVLNNNGYASIRASQSGYFKQTIGCDPGTGLTLPDIRKIVAAFGVKTLRIEDQSGLRRIIRETLDSEGPVVCEVMVQPDQAIGPRASTRIRSDGSMVSTPLEDLFPFLDREELRANMAIPLIEDDK
jgi:acetolactate synthase-1/2/3 large subunit